MAVIRKRLTVEERKWLGKFLGRELPDGMRDLTIHIPLDGPIRYRMECLAEDQAWRERGEQMADELNER